MPAFFKKNYPTIKKLIPAVILTVFCLTIISVAHRFYFKLTNILAQDESVPLGLREALFWQAAGQGNVQCVLCPRNCLIAPGQRGFCRARKNIKGKLYSLTYGRPVAIHVDPIEKKPFFHVYPGTKSLSIATAGCNLRCKFCQNWEISQADPETSQARFVPPQEIVQQAKATGSRTIAFTYTEPTIFYEYMLEVARLAKEENIACVMHSAGFINEEPLKQLAKYLLAADIDLKGFSQEYYASFCQGKLEDVLRTLQTLKKQGVWLEITNLILPGANDTPNELGNLCAWVKENLGPDTPVHFSRFFPMYKLLDLSPTPLETLIQAKEIAAKNGLHYVYIGNVPQHLGEDTFCPVCGKLLVKRIGYNVLEINLADGKCQFCKAKISGVWD